MGKGREFTFKEKLEIISHHENLVASRIKISKKGNDGVGGYQIWCINFTDDNG